MKYVTKSVFLLFIFLLMASPACKKSTPQPDNPELIGSWPGSTSQSQVINFYVDNIGGTLYLTSLKFIILFDTGGQQTIQAYSTSGITPVSNRYFKYILGTGIYGQSFIEGTFNTGNMTLTGTFKSYSPTNPSDYTSGTYYCSKAK